MVESEVLRALCSLCVSNPRMGKATPCRSRRYQMSPAPKGFATVDDMGPGMLTRKKSALASSVFVQWAPVTVSLALLLSPSPEALILRRGDRPCPSVLRRRHPGLPGHEGAGSSLRISWDSAETGPDEKK